MPAEVLKIVHLSDLHFRRDEVSKPPAVWRIVCDFINEKVRPQAVLITGDLTDRATTPEFEYAVECLDQLTAQYWVIPGNHDRFPTWGTTVRFATSIPFIGKRLAEKKARFDHAFPGGRHVTARCPSNINLPSDEDRQWRIRLVGLDSSEEDRWLAQGYGKVESIERMCAGAMQIDQERAIDDDRPVLAKKTGYDLVIALVHHHVMPIPEAEAHSLKARGISGLANATGLLNAGTLLRELSRAHVNLVLHGHEHYRHVARFGASDETASDVVVVAAGSSTGERTRKGWAISRVHFNVLELRDDSSVRLRQVLGEADGASVAYADGWRTLLTAQDIRRARFLRRNRQPSAVAKVDQDSEAEPRNVGATAAAPAVVRRDLPRSTFRAMAEYTLSRDILVTQVRTDFAMPRVWEQVTKSSSGTVSEALFKFEWENAAPEYIVGSFTPINGDPDGYRVGIPLGDRSRKCRRLTVSWAWAGAAALTTRDVASLPRSARTGKRADGMEAAAVRLRREDELLALTLTVRVPPRLAPESDLVQVLFETPERPGILEPSIELQRALDFCGDGTMELRVPYPMPGYRYMIAWPVCEDDCRSADAEAFARTARQGALTWLRDMGEAVRSTLGSGILSLALYVPSEQDEFILERVDGSSAVAPDQLRLSDARSVARASWWGEITVIEKTAADRSEFRGDEMLVAFIPIRGEESVGQEALGLLRLGVGSDSAGVRSLDQKKRQVFQQMLATEASVVLKAFRNAHGGER